MVGIRGKLRSLPNGAAPRWDRVSAIVLSVVTVIITLPSCSIFDSDEPDSSYLVARFEAFSLHTEAGSLDLSPNGQTVAATLGQSPDLGYIRPARTNTDDLYSQTVVVWSLESGERLWGTSHYVGSDSAYHRPDRDELGTIQFSPDGSLLAVGGANLTANRYGWESVAIWETGNYNLATVLPDVGRAIAFSPDGQLLYTGRGILRNLIVARPDTVVRIWNTGEWKQVGYLHATDPWADITSTSAPYNPVKELHLSPDGKLLCLYGMSYSDVWRPTKSVLPWPLPSGVVGFRPRDGFEYSAIRVINGLIQRLSIPGGDVTRWSVETPVRSETVSTDGHWLVTGAYDGRVSVYQTRDGKRVRNMFTGDHAITAVAISRDNSVIVAAGNDGEIVVLRPELNE
jgi:WD40 repeat protein